jgi:TatD DNase family protein
MTEYIDSHCHVNFPELAEDFAGITSRMQANQVKMALCVSVNLPDWDQMMAMVEREPVLWGSVGVHPDYEEEIEPTLEDLTVRSQHPKVVAIGETGLDYYRLTGDLQWQRDRFRTHIRAAREVNLPLIIHTRSAREDTIDILRQENAQAVGGVMHCFTESWEMAQQSMELGFYISFSGIVTFKNAKELQDTATKVPLDRLLIETDSPYLAPVPLRGKRNDPSLVVHVAQKIAELRGISPEEVACASTRNFYNLFKKIQPLPINEVN